MAVCFLVQSTENPQLLRGATTFKVLSQRKDNFFSLNSFNKIPEINSLAIKATSSAGATQGYGLTPLHFSLS